MPHFRMLGVVPHIICALDKSSSLSERIALIHNTRQNIDKLRAHDFFLSCSRYHASQRYQSKINFRRGERLFSSKLLRMASRYRCNIELLTIMVENDGKIYPTHAKRVCPWLSKLSISSPPKVERFFHDRPATPFTHAQSRPSTILELLNPLVVLTSLPIDNSMKFFVIGFPGTSFTVSISQTKNLDIDSD